MKSKLYRLLTITLVIGLLPVCACNQELPVVPTTTTPPAAGSREDQAKAWVNLLAAEQFDQVVEPFDKEMTRQMPSAAMAEAWVTLISQAGEFQDIKSTRTAKQDGYDIVFVTCNFKNAAIDIKVVYDAGGKIAGLYFLPASGPAVYAPPAYGDPAKFTETEVTVGTGQWQLPATLTMPKGDGPFPAVVLVHGSGPNDRDETLGGNKPFQDLAWGLASRGIAVLRYEKRTKQYPAECAAMIDSFTVEDETIDDALAAVDLLSQTKGIDSQKIFVLGHSLGGMLIPRIAAGDNRLAGVIVLAGPTRKLDDLMLEQVRYLAGLDGKTDDTEALHIRLLEEQVQKVKALDIKAGELILGAGRVYWQDLNEYDPVAEAEKLTLPLLILQGERDYQVTMVDFGGWSEALTSRDNVTLKSYADLNHLFITGSGISTPAEYDKAGNVAEKVVDDIAGWVKR